MSGAVVVKTGELIGAALDWAVAKATTQKHWPVIVGKKVMLDTDYEHILFSPSTDWSQGGPLIEKYALTIHQVSGCAATFADDTGEADYDGRNMRVQEGETPLIAACRVIVLAELGETVTVPAELAQSS